MNHSRMIHIRSIQFLTTQTKRVHVNIVSLLKHVRYEKFRVVHRVRLPGNVIIISVRKPGSSCIAAYERDDAAAEAARARGKSAIFTP